MTDASAPPAPSRRRQCRRVAAASAFVIGIALLFWYESGQAPQGRGDAWEYWYQVESLHRHGSPDLWPEDVAAVNGAVVREGVGTAPTPPYAYATAPDGRMYGVHFWAYALSAVPAKECLRWAGRSELAAPQVANAGWVAFALGVALFGSKAPVRERLAVAGLATVGPAVWYVEWVGAETFSWALVLVSVVAYRDRRYGWAGAAAGLSATQNPTVVFLGAAAVLAAAWERRWRAAAAAACGTALAFLPFAFFQYHFGRPNLIAAEFSSVRYLSWVRTWGLLTDFNQGLLPYTPLLMLGAVVGAVRLAYTRNVHGLLLVGGGVGMAVGVEVQHNWNSGCVGLQRYLVWMLPVAAGVAVEGIGGRRAVVFSAVAVATHAAVFYGYYRAEMLKGDYLSHTPIASWVLIHAPRAYWVEPEVFVERECHWDGWPLTPADFPIGSVRPDGSVGKLLLDAGSVDKLAERFEAESGYMAALKERAAVEPGLFYAHPPAGAVRIRRPADQLESVR